MFFALALSLSVLCAAPGAPAEAAEPPAAAQLDAATRVVAAADEGVAVATAGEAVALAAADEGVAVATAEEAVAVATAAVATATATATAEDFALAASSASAADRTERQPDSSWLIPAAHGAALMGGMRLSLSLLWPDAFNPLPVRRSLQAFGQNVSAPPHFDKDRALFESDGDPWALNVVGHGLMGSELYLRARQCGQEPLAAVAFTTAASAAWEYGLEALHQRPSAIDLVWTPLAGLLFGELRFQLYRATGSGVVRVFVDPFGEVERALGTRC